MLLAFKMLLSLVFLSFNIYLLADLSILPLLFLPWHFLFKIPECLPAVGKGKVYILACILSPLHRPSLTAAAQTQSFVTLCLLIPTWPSSPAGAPPGLPATPVCCEHWTDTVPALLVGRFISIPFNNPLLWGFDFGFIALILKFGQWLP